jgi:capsular polysaccharide biosynthesis protein
MRPEWAHLFHPDHAYAKVKLGARKLRNVFVNHYGLVIDNGLLVAGCAPNIGFGSYDEGFYYSHWRKAMEQNLVCRYGKSLNFKRLDDNRTYLIIHSPWFSYYFWLTECIPRLLMVKEYLKDLVLIYPESWSRLPFVNETLALFPELQIEIIPDDVHLYVTSLVMPEVKPWTPMFIPDQVLAVRQLLIPKLAKSTSSSTPKTKICITRKGTFRNFEHYNSVESILFESGYLMVAMEKLSFFEQIEIMNSATSVLGISGAGHTNVHFMPPGSSFLDITAIINIEKKKYKLHFHKLANIIGVNYLVQFAKNVPTENVPYYNQNVIVDFSELEKNLSLMNH